MDIQEIKNFAKNKIESDDLANEVRRQRKETTGEKQNQREGFSETFKPLISQFEKLVIFLLKIRKYFKIRLKLLKKLKKTERC